MPVLSLGNVACKDTVFTCRTSLTWNFRYVRSNTDSTLVVQTSSPRKRNILATISLTSSMFASATGLTSGHKGIYLFSRTTKEETLILYVDEASGIVVKWSLGNAISVSSGLRF